MKRICKSISLMTALVMILSLFPMTVSAASEKTEVIGKYYEYDKDSHYEFHEGGASEQTTKENTYGTFYISGNITAERVRYCFVKVESPFLVGMHRKWKSAWSREGGMPG